MPELWGWGRAGRQSGRLIDWRSPSWPLPGVLRPPRARKYRLSARSVMADDPSRSRPHSCPPVTHVVREPPGAAANLMARRACSYRYAMAEVDRVTVHALTEPMRVCLDISYSSGRTAVPRAAAFLSPGRRGGDPSSHCNTDRNCSFPHRAQSNSPAAAPLSDSDSRSAAPGCCSPWAFLATHLTLQTLTLRRQLPDGGQSSRQPQP